MERKVILALAIASVSVFGEPSFAAEKYVIDPEHVWVNFAIQQSVYAKNIGRFNDVKGVILFDKDNVAASSVSVEIMAESVDTANEDRDFEVQSEFLNAGKFPKITFISTSVEKTGENKGKIVGDLTLAGTTKPVTLDVTFDGEAASRFTGKMTVGFSATGALNIEDFNIFGPRTLAIHPDLEFTIEADAIKE